MSYNPEMCKALINHCSHGKSLESFSARMGVSPKEITEWYAIYPDFRDAVEMAPCTELFYWEEKLITAIEQGDNVFVNVIKSRIDNLMKHISSPVKKGIYSELKETERNRRQIMQKTDDVLKDYNLLGIEDLKKISPEEITETIFEEENGFTETPSDENEILSDLLSFVPEEEKIPLEKSADEMEKILAEMKEIEEVLKASEEVQEVITEISENTEMIAAQPLSDITRNFELPPPLIPEEEIEKMIQEKIKIKKSIKEKKTSSNKKGKSRDKKQTPGTKKAH